MKPCNTVLSNQNGYGGLEPKCLRWVEAVRRGIGLWGGDHPTTPPGKERERARRGDGDPPRYRRKFSTPRVVAGFCKEGHHRSVAFLTLLYLFGSGSVKVHHTSPSWHGGEDNLRPRICAARKCKDRYGKIIQP